MIEYILQVEVNKMKLGILISSSGAFLFEMPSDNKVITNEYIRENMVGWFFHAPNIQELIFSMSIEKYYVLDDTDSVCGKLIEITKENLKQLYSSMIKPSRKRIYKRVK